MPEWVFTGEPNLDIALAGSSADLSDRPRFLFAHSPTDKLVAKPDQLIKRRGKAGLLCLNKDYQVSGDWVQERAGKPCTVEKTTGTLNTFILEPFLPHPQDSEYYVCVNSAREGDWILFTQ